MQHPPPEEILSASPSPAIAAHLRDCPACRQIRQEFADAESWQALDQEAPLPAAVDTAIRLEIAVAAARIRRRRQIRIAAAAAAAAALLIAALLLRPGPDADLDGDRQVDVLDARCYALALKRGAPVPDLDGDGRGGPDDLAKLRRDIVALAPEAGR